MVWYGMVCYGMGSAKEHSREVYPAQFPDYSSTIPVLPAQFQHYFQHNSSTSTTIPALFPALQFIKSLSQDVVVILNE